MKIKWPKWSRLINHHFIPLNENHDRYLILWGGRGSSKTDYIAKRLIYRCLAEKYFRFILIRNNYNSIKDSQYQTLKDIIYDLKLESLFEFKLQPLEIECKNGNKFIARGCDDTTKLKSVKDPTGAWYEEDIPEESDFITITTSIRTLKAPYLQEIFTINPEVTGNFEEHWFWKKFFLGKAEKSFSDKTVIEIEGKQIEIRYTSHHSTYHNNRWLPPEFKAFLEEMKKTNPYYYTIYCLGEWGNKQIGGIFYKSFSRAKHIHRFIYDPKESLHISFDFNVKPYCTLTVWQIHGKIAKQIDEILGKEPFNNTAGVCKIFANKYREHQSNVFIYGDPSGRAQDTRQEKGFNDFTIAMKELNSFRPQIRVSLVAPSVAGRGGFINAIFADNYEGISISINDHCNYTIMDYSYGKEAMDGTKLKEKFKDDDGIQSERYHHITDANDYLLCYVFRKEFNKYLRGGRMPEFTPGEIGQEFVRR